MPRLFQRGSEIDSRGREQRAALSGRTHGKDPPPSPHTSPSTHAAKVSPTRRVPPVGPGHGDDGGPVKGDGFQLPAASLG